MGEVLRFKRRRRWTRQEDFGARRGPNRWLQFLPLWVGAVAVGTACGAGWLPNVAALGDFGAAAGTVDGARVHFSYCKWGGGTDCVVDGDTIYLHGAKIRIAGIDAPETHDYRCGSELKLGERAARRLQDLVNSGAVTLSPIDRDRDVYGRLLRNVAVNGQDVGDALVSEGLARPYAGGRRSWC